MKILDWCGILFVFVLGGVAADAKSLLVPMEMPKTISDVSFVDHMENEIDGYEPYAGLTAYQKLQFLEMEADVLDSIDEDIANYNVNSCENGVCKIFSAGCPGGVCVRDAADCADGSCVVSGTPAGGGAGASGQLKGSKTINNGLTYIDPYRLAGLKHPYIKPGQKIPFGLPINVEDMSILMKERNQSAYKGKFTARILQNLPKIGNGGDYGCFDRGSGVRPHTGTDLAMGVDFFQMPVYATADGVVEGISYADERPMSGNWIRLDHGNGWGTQYIHLENMFVSVGQRVQAGTVIGSMGHTGRLKETPNTPLPAHSIHLHYEIFYSGKLPSTVTAPNGKEVKLRCQENDYRCASLKCASGQTKGFFLPGHRNIRKLFPDDLMLVYTR